MRPRTIMRATGCIIAGKKNAKPGLSLRQPGFALRNQLLFDYALVAGLVG